MRYTMQTQSGAVYAIDEDAKTWRRVGAVSIYGLDRDRGTFDDYPEPRLGRRCHIWDSEVGEITTTQVVRLEKTS